MILVHTKYHGVKTEAKFIDGDAIFFVIFVVVLFQRRVNVSLTLTLYTCLPVHGQPLVTVSTDIQDPNKLLVRKALFLKIT